MENGQVQCDHRSDTLTDVFKEVFVLYTLYGFACKF